jgi:hypothetical protein
VVLLDDVASSGHTLAGAARLLLAAGAASVDVAVTHALFAGDACQIDQGRRCGNIWSTDCIAHPSNAVSMAGLPLPKPLISQPLRTFRLDTPQDLDENSLADAWAYSTKRIQMPVFLCAPMPTAWPLPTPSSWLRRETRGIRFQLELLKPDLDQQEQGIENTVVVFGSARFSSPETRTHRWMKPAKWPVNPARWREAERHMRNAHYYDQARLFGQHRGHPQRRLPGKKAPVHLHRWRPRHHGSRQPRRTRSRRPDGRPQHCPAP